MENLTFTKKEDKIIVDKEKTEVTSQQFTLQEIEDIILDLQDKLVYWEQIKTEAKKLGL